MRPLYEIAADIEEAWDTMPPSAAQWVDAMTTLDDISSPYYEGNGRTVVARFLSEAGGWTTEEGLRIRGELSSMLSHHPGRHRRAA